MPSFGKKKGGGRGRPLGRGSSLREGVKEKDEEMEEKLIMDEEEIEEEVTLGVGETSKSGIALSKKQGKVMKKTNHGGKDIKRSVAVDHSWGQESEYGHEEAALEETARGRNTIHLIDVKSPKIESSSTRSGSSRGKGQLGASVRPRPASDGIVRVGPPSSQKRARYSTTAPARNTDFVFFEDEDEEDDFFFDDEEYQKRRQKKRTRTTNRAPSKPRLVEMEEANFGADEEQKFSDNGCPVYCSTQMTLTLAQQLIFKEDKDMERVCTKVPNTYAGMYSVYLLNLQNCDTVTCYTDMVEDLYGTWGGCKRRYVYFRYLDDGSVEKVDGGTKEAKQEWDFSIQENTYQHPHTREMESHFKKKIYTVRYNGKGGEIVQTWAIITYEWSEGPLDIEFPPPKYTGKPRTKGAPIVGEGGNDKSDGEDDYDMDPTIRYSGNGCPVYCCKPITHKLAEEIIFDPDKRLDLVCDKVPSGFVGRKSVYLIDLQKTPNVNVFGDLTVDSYGTWGNGNSKCWYYRYGEDDTVERIAALKNGRRPGNETKWDFILQESRYPCHPQTKDLPSQFKRRVYTIRDKRAPTEIVKTWAVIGYYWTAEPIKFDIAPHGNARKEHVLGVGYQRTRPTVRKILEEKLQAGFTPKEVFSSTHEELGGIVGADTAGDLPSTPVQVYNLARHLRKANLLPSPKELRTKRGQGMEPWIPTDPWDPAKTNNYFMMEYDFHNGEPIALCSDERMMTIFKMYCLLEEESEREIRPLFMDSTFEVGPTFVTPVMTQHPDFEQKTGLVPWKEPIIPVAYMVSKNKSKEEFRWLGDALRRKSGAGERERVSAVITDDDPEMFGGLSECSLFDEPCCFILCGVNLQNNVKSVLEECRVEPQEVTAILGQIFGKEHQFSVDKGRIRKGDRVRKGLIDCHTVQEFDEMLEEYEQYWDPTFYNWFIRYKVPYIRNRFFVSGNEGGTGWINANRIEAMKFHFMQTLEGNYAEDNIVDTLRKYSDSVFAKLESAPFDLGEYQIKDEMNRWAVKSEGTHFNDTPKEVRMARLAEFGLNRNPKEAGVGPLLPMSAMLATHNRVQSLSMPLVENLKVPVLVGAYSSRVTQCERAAVKFVADDCVKQLKNKAQYAVEDVVASISAIFVVERCGGGGLRCQFGFQVCEAFKMFRSTFCEHTVAVAEFNGELKEHIQHINNNFPENPEDSFDVEPSSVSSKHIPVVSVKETNIGRANKVVEVVNPLQVEDRKPPRLSLSGQLEERGVVKRGRAGHAAAPSAFGLVPDNEQMAELKRQKPLIYDEVPEHAYYNGNVFFLKHGAPPAEGMEKVRCKKCRKPFVMPKEPGYLPPADIYILHHEVDVSPDLNTGDILITEEEVPVYLHAKYKCIAERYPYFYPEGYLKCEGEDREKLGRVHHQAIAAHFGVTMTEIGTE